MDSGMSNFDDKQKSKYNYRKAKGIRYDCYSCENIRTGKRCSFLGCVVDYGNICDRYWEEGSL